MVFEYKCKVRSVQTRDSAMALIAGKNQAIVVHANGCQDSVLGNIAEPIIINMSVSLESDAM